MAAEQMLVRRLGDLDAHKLELRRGVVVDDDPLAVIVGGAAEPYRNLRSLIPVFVDDVVELLVGDHQALVLGRVDARRVLTATATTSGPTTSSTAEPMTAVVPQMSITDQFRNAEILLSYSLTVFKAGSGPIALRTALYDGDTEIPRSRRQVSAENSFRLVIAAEVPHTPDAGERTFSLRWNVSGSTGESQDLQRSLVIKEA